jgi:hypothetical protein
MPTIKRCCTYVVNETPTHRIKTAFPPGAHHSSYALALEALDDYCHWVSEAVLPIAFAWIEDNYDDVYRHIPPEYRDDVAVVIAAAFQLVQKLPVYKRGLEIGKDIHTEQQLTLPCVDPAHPDYVDVPINPVWTHITKENTSRVRNDWEGYRRLLDGTIHWK